MARNKDRAKRTAKSEATAEGISAAADRAARDEDGMGAAENERKENSRNAKPAMKSHKRPPQALQCFKSGDRVGQFKRENRRSTFLDLYRREKEVSEFSYEARTYRIPQNALFRHLLTFSFPSE